MGKSVVEFWCISFIHCCIMCERFGLRVETSEEFLHVSSPLGTRVRVDQIC